jgi:hypothetical protein
MRRAPAKLIAIVLAALTVSGSGIAAASAKPSAASVAHHGTEHFTLMDTLTRSGAATIIATGLFTDGGTISIGQPGRSGEMKLGRGTIRLTSNNGSGITKVNMATCLTTQTGRHLQAHPRHWQVRRHPRFRPLHHDRPQGFTAQAQRQLCV